MRRSSLVSAAGLLAALSLRDTSPVVMPPEVSAPSVEGFVPTGPYSRNRSGSTRARKTNKQQKQKRKAQSTSRRRNRR